MTWSTESVKIGKTKGVGWNLRRNSCAKGGVSRGWLLDQGFPLSLGCSRVAWI